MHRHDTHARSGSRHASTIEVRVRGALDAWSAPKCSEELQQALLLYPALLLIDLSECVSIDHVGVLVLLDTHRRAGLIGCSVALSHPTPPVEAVLQRSKVNRFAPFRGAPAVPHWPVA